MIAHQTDTICFDCAKERGGRWPEAHKSNCQGGICPYCGGFKSLTAYDNFIWPGQTDQEVTDWKIYASGL